MSSQLSAGAMAIPPDPTDTSAGRPSALEPRGGGGGGGASSGAPQGPPRAFARQAPADPVGRSGARVGLAWVVVLAFCGVFAPFIANSHPILLKTGGRWSSPLVRHLTPADVILLLATAAALYAVFLMGRHTFRARALVVVIT